MHEAYLQTSGLLSVTIHTISLMLSDNQSPEKWRVHYYKSRFFVQVDVAEELQLIVCYI